MNYENQASVMHGPGQKKDFFPVEPGELDTDKLKELSLAYGKQPEEVKPEVCQERKDTGETKKEPAYQVGDMVRIKSLEQIRKEFGEPDDCGYIETDGSYITPRELCEIPGKSYEIEKIDDTDFFLKMRGDWFTWLPLEVIAGLAEKPAPAKLPAAPFIIDLTDDNSRKVQEAVQKKLFAMGYKWWTGKKIHEKKELKIITVYEDKEISSCSDCKDCGFEGCKKQILSLLWVKAADFLESEA